MDIAFAAPIQPGKLSMGASVEHCAGDGEFALALAQSDPPEVLAEGSEDPGPPKGGAPDKPQDSALVSWLVPALAGLFPTAVPIEASQMASAPMGQPVVKGSSGPLKVSLAEDLHPSPSQSPAVGGLGLARQRQPALIPAFTPLRQGVATALGQALSQATPLGEKAPASQPEGERAPETQAPAQPLDQAELAAPGVRENQAPRASGELVRVVEGEWETVPSRPAPILTPERATDTPSSSAVEGEVPGASAPFPPVHQEAIVLRIPPSKGTSIFAETAEVIQAPEVLSVAPAPGHREQAPVQQPTVLPTPPSREGSALAETAEVAQPSEGLSAALAPGRQEESPGPETGPHQMLLPQEEVMFASGILATLDRQAPEFQTVSTPLMRTQVVQQVLEKLERLTLGEGVSEVELRLKPTWLGRVHIRLRLESELLEIHMYTQTQEAREILQASLPQLELAFQQQGIQVVDLTISQGIGTGGFGLTPDGAPGHSNPGPGSPPPAPSELPAEPGEARPHSTTTPSGEHIIDCWI